MLVSDFAPDILSRLMETQRYPLIPQVEIAKTCYLGILDAVRNAILAWSLKLEADGIVGEGLSFSPKEKRTRIRKGRGPSTRRQLHNDRTHGELQHPARNARVVSIGANESA